MDIAIILLFEGAFVGKRVRTKKREDGWLALSRAH
jgi:hypothetical protein